MIRRIRAALRQKLGSLLPFRSAAREVDPLTVRVVDQVPDAILSTARANGLYLDRTNITGLLGTTNGMMGAIAPTSAGRVSIVIARRMADRFARAHAAKFELEPKLIADALCFEFWSQLCVLIPLRHLARKLAKQAMQESILIELPSASITCLELWKPNQLEPLFLYAELLRRGAKAFLLCQNISTGSSGMSDETRTLRFGVGTNWWAPPLSAPRVPCPLDSRKAIVVSAIRGVDRILAEHGPMHVIACVFSPPDTSCEALTDEGLLPPETTVTLSRKTFRTIHGPLPGYTGTVASLMDYVLLFFQALLPQAARNAERIVGKRRITELHCCDHYFLESALMSHAVKKAGGRVILWPHSANPNHQDIRSAEEIDEIHCITQSGKRIWNSRLPDVPVIAQPRLMLHPPRGPRPGDAGSPLSVVIIGGAYVLGRLPILPIRKHAELYRQLFARLGEHAGSMDVYFRPKPLFEDENWLREGVGIRDGYRIAEREPMAIEAPNPVFVMVSLASTAVLEGIGRGIPSLIVRGFPVRDYINVDDRYIPTGSPEFIMNQLALCRDEAYRAEILSRQIEWYNSECGAALP